MRLTRVSTGIEPGPDPGPDSGPGARSRGGPSPHRRRPLDPGRARRLTRRRTRVAALFAAAL
ncbi:hypothetical protein ACFQL8_17675, partial [Streptomyces goshikiensis]|uniref:hypothetical protein n=1 Tax=Streptomyces goshikiensis TaxID=1942 RepID=UPI0036127B7D